MGCKECHWFFRETEECGVRPVLVPVSCRMSKGCSHFLSHEHWESFVDVQQTMITLRKQMTKEQEDGLWVAR